MSRFNFELTLLLRCQQHAQGQSQLDSHPGARVVPRHAWHHPCQARTTLFLVRDRAQCGQLPVGQGHHQCRQLGILRGRQRRRAVGHRTRQGAEDQVISRPTDPRLVCLLGAAMTALGCSDRQTPVGGSRSAASQSIAGRPASAAPLPHPATARSKPMSSGLPDTSRPPPPDVPPVEWGGIRY